MRKPTIQNLGKETNNCLVPSLAAGVKGSHCVKLNLGPKKLECLPHYHPVCILRSSEDVVLYWKSYCVVMRDVASKWNWCSSCIQVFCIVHTTLLASKCKLIFPPSPFNMGSPFPGEIQHVTCTCFRWRACSIWMTSFQYWTPYWTYKESSLQWCPIYGLPSP